MSLARALLQFLLRSPLAPILAEVASSAIVAAVESLFRGKKTKDDRGDGCGR